MYPIWKDHYINLGTADKREFRILLYGAEIYRGVAYKRPGAANNLVRINDICADFLRPLWPTIAHETTTYGLSEAFGVQGRTATGWENLGTLEFLNDWSYDYLRNISGREGVTDNISAPITGRVAENMPLVVSLFQDGNVVVDYGASEWEVELDEPGTLVLLPSSMPEGTKELTISGGFNPALRYEIVPACHRFALYYLNAFGGWDFLLIEGATSETDSLDRKTYDADYNNNDSANAGRFNYLNTLEHNYTFHTGWLSDEQSARMHHLLNSTRVMLYDMQTELFTPVLLTDRTTEYKTYKGNGGKMVDYTINATIAKEMCRK